MSHHKDSASISDLQLFKFQGTADDFYTVVHNIGDLRPVVEVYNSFTDIRINDAIIEVVDANTITITLGAAQNVRGTVIGAPDPGE